MADRIGIMLPIPFTEAKFNAMPKPVIVQPKLEGDRMRAIPNPLRLRSSGDKERVSVPHIRQALEDIILPFETDGELYTYGMRHSEIRSIVSRTKNLHPDYLLIRYHIYDIVSPEDQQTRINMLRTILKHEYIKIVRSFPCYSTEEFQEYYDTFLAQGYEGIIIRHPDRPYKRSQVQWMLKLKPRLSGEYRIIGALPLVDKEDNIHDTMGAFVLEDSEGRVFNVGTGPTASDRLLFWNNAEELIGKMCKIRFQGFTNARNVPKMQSIDKEWLAKMRKEISKWRSSY